jgi:hypothetical protein
MSAERRRPWFKPLGERLAFVCLIGVIVVVVPTQCAPQARSGFSARRRRSRSADVLRAPLTPAGRVGGLGPGL